MRCGLFRCPERWVDWLPPGMLRPDGRGAEETVWDLLALTAEGCRELRQSAADVHCGALLLPGEEPLPQNLRAESVVTYGLSHRDTLTLSSLGEMPVLCLQRRLSASGEIIDARELPMTAEKLLLLYGFWLLGAG